MENPNGNQLTQFEEIETMLMERIIDVLESPEAKLCAGIAMVEDPAGEGSELHVRMARAAMQEYIRTVQLYSVTSKIVHQ